VEEYSEKYVIHRMNHRNEEVASMASVATHAECSLLLEYIFMEYSIQVLFNPLNPKYIFVIFCHLEKSYSLLENALQSY